MEKIAPKLATPTDTREADLTGTLFGVFKVQARDGLTINLKNRRAVLLLAILFLEPDHCVDRELLTRLLWPDRFSAQAKASLRQCLLELRKHLQELNVDALSVDRKQVALNTVSIRSDLSGLELMLSQGRLAEAADAILQVGNLPLLEGATLNPEFDTWLASRRDHFDVRLKSALIEAIPAAEPTEQERLLEVAKARFPTLKAGETGLNRKVMAVLPFHQEDGLTDGLYMADGVVDELSSRLGSIPGIALVGRSSVSAVVSDAKTLPQMATALGASHLIEGAVGQRGEKIEVRIALIDGASGIEIWADKITGVASEFFEGRKVIGSNVIASIGKALGLPITVVPSRRMTPDREAYTLYLQGSALGQQIGIEGAYERSVELLKRAIEIDPDFAECWTALANVHIMIAATTPSLKRIEQSAEGAACAKRAIALDPNQGHAFSVLGVHEWTQFNPARALEMSLEAYARDPNSSNVASRLGSCLLYLGKTQEALPYVEEAVDRDPVYWRNTTMLALAYLGLGEFEKALVAAQRMVDVGGPGMFLAIAQMALGDREAAVQSHYDTRFFLDRIFMRPPGVAKMDDAARDAYFDLAARGIFGGKQEDRDAYCQMLDGLHVTMADPYDSTLCFPAIAMGHSDLVMKMYSECIHPANMFILMMLWVDIDPINRTIRHPGFMAFAEKIGMVEAWNRFGWPDLIPSDPRLS